MTACMHAAVDATPEFNLSLFVHRQRIHVRAQRNAGLGASADCRDNSSSSYRKLIWNVQLIENLSNELSGVDFFVHHLGTHVQLSPNIDNPILNRLRFGEHV